MSVAFSLWGAAPAAPDLALPTTQRGAESASAAAAPERTYAGRLVAVEGPDGPLEGEALEGVLERRAAELIDEAKGSGDAEACVRAAEFVLARRIEPALSRELLGLATAADRAEVAEQAGVAAALLDDAEERGGDELTDELEDRIERARAYAALFAALCDEPDGGANRRRPRAARATSGETPDVTPPDTAAETPDATDSAPADAPGAENAAPRETPDDGRDAADESRDDTDDAPRDRAGDKAGREHTQRIVAACRGVAWMLDLSNRSVSSSARMWQAAAYRRAGRADRTLQVLPRVGERPEGLPYDFFSRLERCRALGDRGDFSAALALTLRIESRLAGWLPESQRESGRHALLLAQESLWRGWAAALSKSGESERADEAMTRADEVRRRIENAGAGAYRLGLAIGGVEAPLESARTEESAGEPAAGASILGIACGESPLVVVLDASGAEERVWAAACQAVDGLLAGVGDKQTFAVIAVEAEAVRSYPVNPYATATRGEAAAAREFVGGVRGGEAERSRLTDALLRAIALKPGVIVLVTGAGVEEGFVSDLARLARQGRTRVHVVWIGGEKGAAAGKRVAGDCGGEFRVIEARSEESSDE